MKEMALINGGRPVVYDYGSAPAFLTDLMRHYRAQGPFSLRQRTAKVGACSQSLVSQILKGQRQLKRDHLPALTLIFKLTPPESKHLDDLLTASLRPPDPDLVSSPVRKHRQTRNHLLSDWLHPYVKDLVHLRGFRLDPAALFAILRGVAPSARIQKSIQFLLREGFWRTNAAGEVVPEESAVTTTNEIPNLKIRAFHKKALEIAARGLSTLPVEKRKASTILLSIDQEHFEDLKALVDSFQHQLLNFIEKHPKGQDSLVQVSIHLTPIGEAPHET